MNTYWILPHPGISAVFFDASEALSLAELTLCLRRLGTPCENPRALSAFGLRWYAFDAESPLPEVDMARLARLSSLYAVFLCEGEASLRPLEAPRTAPFGEDLSAILKYTGKTNALFTRLMLHIAALSLPNPPKGPIRLLDPVAGKGTALFEGLMRGWDVTGVEIVQKAAHESAVYFQKYLETEKWKHKQVKVKSYGAPSWQLIFARDKDTLKASPGHFTMVAGDSRNAEKYFGKAAFDIVCGDLPYGVAHGNIAGASLSRSPEALLKACLGAWRGVLKSKGILALSWNTFVLPTVDMVSILTEHGFDCLRDAPYDVLEHRVDAAIRRDIVVAVKRG